MTLFRIQILNIWAADPQIDKILCTKSCQIDLKNDKCTRFAAFWTCFLLGSRPKLVIFRKNGKIYKIAILLEVCAAVKAVK